MNFSKLVLVKVIANFYSCVVCLLEINLDYEISLTPKPRASRNTVLVPVIIQPFLFLHSQSIRKGPEGAAGWPETILSRCTWHCCFYQPKLVG
jgi:hypothetical protein